MSLTDQYLVVATAAAREHYTNDLDVARIISAATLGLVSAGWRLPGLMAATPDLVESLRTNGDGRVYCVDTETGQARYGRNGLMSAEERAFELAAEPGMAGPYVTHT